MKTITFCLSSLVFGVLTCPAAEVLFDGKNLNHFEFEKGAWEIEKDGSVVCRIQEQKDKKGQVRLRGMGYLWTKRNSPTLNFRSPTSLARERTQGSFIEPIKTIPSKVALNSS